MDKKVKDLLKCFPAEPYILDRVVKNYTTGKFEKIKCAEYTMRLLSIHEEDECWTFANNIAKNDGLDIEFDNFSFKLMICSKALCEKEPRVMTDGTLEWIPVFSDLVEMKKHFLSSDLEKAMAFYNTMKDRYRNCF